MRLRKSIWIVLLSATVMLSACNMPLFEEPTATPTFTPVPSPTAPPTNTPLPTLTPTATVDPLSLLPTATATFLFPTSPPVITPSPKPEEAILLYYFNLKVKGRFGCGEDLWWVNTGIYKSYDTPADIRTALTRLFSYHGEYWGNLYNPYGPSTFEVRDVKQTGEFKVEVYLGGTYVSTKDNCDKARLKDQIRQTIFQFRPISNLNVYLNGVPLGDAISRK